MLAMLDLWDWFQLWLFGSGCLNCFGAILAIATKARRRVFPFGVLVRSLPRFAFGAKPISDIALIVALEIASVSVGVLDRLD
jgi:hypothetical protein